MTDYEFKFEIPDTAKKALASMTDFRGLGQRLALTMDRENELTVNRIQRKLSGEVLNVQSSTLRRSIGATRAIVKGASILSAVGSGARFGHKSVAYAAILEFGGTTRPHVIRPRNKKVLAFPCRGGGTVFAHSVNHPGSKIPERSYIRSTLNERAINYSRALGATVGSFLRGGVA
ncbi:MAG: hypothetical protein KGL39_33480 [Patescibacteria group bacterium]|nr:hypothetical protein [Patescibacteria group bacterium]